MVSVVAPRNSVPGIVNLALTIQQLRKEGKKVKSYVVSGKNLVEFWNNLSKYADPTDKSLVVLDLPRPEIDAIKKLKLEPGKIIVIYITSELNSPNREEREALIELGITVVPSRKTYESFLGDITQDNTKWVNVSRILSMEERRNNIDANSLNIAKGIAETAFRSPREAINRILADNTEYFRAMGARHDIKPDMKFSTPDGQVVLVEAKATYPRYFADAFAVCLNTNVDPIAIHGKFNGIFTLCPSYFARSDQNETFSFLARFGRGAVISLKKRSDPEAISVLVGAAQRPFLLRISDPKFLTTKTLQRRLVGGTTSQEIKGKKYEKKYRSLSDKHPRVQVIREDLVLVPGGALEDVVALLHESGSTYEFVSAETMLKAQSAPISNDVLSD